MVITPHALAGAALAPPRRPVSALFLGMASHYGLDAVPHRDYDYTSRLGRVALVADAACAIGILALSGARREQWWGALGGILPDLLCVAEQNLGPTRAGAAHDRFHHTTHTTENLANPANALVQGATALLAGAFVRGRARRAARG